MESAGIQILTAELAQAKNHLQECNGCQSFIEQQKSLSRLLKEKLGAVPTPPSVREDVLQAIARRRFNSKQSEKRGLWSIPRFWIAAAALILALISGSLLLHKQFIGPPEKNNFVEDLIDDHIRNRLAIQTVELKTDDPLELSRWFGSRLDFSARIPSISSQQLVGGRLCYLFDRRLALAFYQKEDDWISLFILRGKGIDLSGTEKIGRNGKVFCSGHGKGYQLIAWEEQDLLYALVSDQDVLELVKKLRF